VKSVGDGTFAITAQDGTTVTVNVSSATTYMDQGVTSASIANVTVGEHVAVFGTDTSNTVAATSVAIGSPPAGGKGGPMGAPGGKGGTPPAAVGTVKSVGDGTFAIAAQDGTTVTVNVSSATTYMDQGVTSASIANVTVGEHVAVFGTDTSNTVAATSVAIGSPPAGGKGGPMGASSGSPGGGPLGPGGTPPATSSSS
jgi:preprotein translocase subunit YajC